MHKPDPSFVQTEKSNQYASEEEQSYAHNQTSETISASTAYISNDGKVFELFELENMLRTGLEERNITDIKMLSGRIKRIEGRIEQYQEEGRPNEAAREMEYLHQLQNLQILSDHIIMRYQSHVSAVLTDMINKTKVGAEKIDPLSGDPKRTIERLKQVRGIMYPRDVFQFSMSENTQACIASQVQRDSSNVKVALKHRNHALVKHYLNNVKTLNDLLEQSSIRDAYAELVRFVSNTINEHCSEVMKKFNRALASQDGLRDEDIREYKSCVEYIEQIQVLRENIGPDLLLPDTLMVNIRSELDKRAQSLHDEELHSVSMRVHLNNFHRLQGLSTELVPCYTKACEDFICRVKMLVKEAPKLIIANEIGLVNEMLNTVSECSFFSDSLLNAKVKKIPGDIVQLLLRHLNSFIKNIDSILCKYSASSSDIEMLKKYMNTLRLAIRMPDLNNHVSAYGKLERKQSNVSVEDITDLNEIYKKIISLIVKHFENINTRIQELFESNGDLALEFIEEFFVHIENMRTVPELEVETHRTFHRILENTQRYMRQFQRDAEHLLSTVNPESTQTNYKHLGKSLLRLKNARWFDRFIPGTYNSMIRNIREDLEERASRLERNLMKLDISMGHPANIHIANDIVEKMQSMIILEVSIPELRSYRDRINQYFVRATRNVFVHIQKTFNLSCKTFPRTDEESSEQEQLTNEYQNMHPASVYLRKFGYFDVGELNREIENLRIEHKLRLETLNTEKLPIDSELDRLDLIIQNYAERTSKQVDRGFFQTLMRKVVLSFQNTNDYLTQNGYASIEDVYQAKKNIQEADDEMLRSIEKMNSKFLRSAAHFNLIKDKYQLLFVSKDFTSSNGNNVLEEKDKFEDESPDVKIKEKDTIFDQNNTDRVSFDFSEKVDASTANNALAYIDNCKKASLGCIKKMAVSMNDCFGHFLQEYGNCLNQKIDEKFNSIINTEKSNRSQHSEDLEMLFQELSSLSEMELIFERIDGVEKLRHWHLVFSNYYRYLDHHMEDSSIHGRSEELKTFLLIAQALSCLDRFCIAILSGNEFHSLYRQHQAEISRISREAYRSVLEHVSKGDYAHADMILSDMDYSSLDEKCLGQIKNDLHFSLNKLMKNTRTSGYRLDETIAGETDSQNKIRDVNINIEKVVVVLNSDSIIKLVDGEMKIRLEKFHGEIHEILSSALLKGLSSIDIFLNNNNFLEAEQLMEKIIDAQSQLVDYMKSEIVDNRMKEVNSRFNNLVSDSLLRWNFADVDRYSVNSPVDLLNQVKRVLPYRVNRYTHVYTCLLEEIRHCFNLAIETVHDMPENDRSRRIRSIQCSVEFLPEELKMEYKSEINKLIRPSIDHDKKLKTDVFKSLKDNDEDNQTISKFRSLVQQVTSDKKNERFNVLHDEILKKLRIYRADVERFLLEKDLKSAIDTLKKIFVYRESVGNHIPGVEEICTHVRDLIVRAFEASIKVLSTMPKIEDTALIEKNFLDVAMCIQFSMTFNEYGQEVLTESVLQSSQREFKKIYQYLCDNSQKFPISLHEKDFFALRSIVLESKRWDGLVQLIKEYQIKHHLIQSGFQDIKGIVLYTDMISSLESYISNIKSQLSVELINERRTKNDDERNEFFAAVMKSISELKEIDAVFNNILPSILDAEKIVDELKDKIQGIGSQLCATAKKEDLNESDCEYFCMNYKYIMSINTHVRISGFDVQSILTESEEYTFKKVLSLRKVMTEPGLDMRKVAQALIKMKFLARNLFVLDRKILCEIDHALRVYKLQYSSTAIWQLMMILETTDLGNRLIYEHSCLIAVDTRKRREKMQKQDDLKYVLDQLRGDYVAKDVLETRYKSFRKTYDKLIANTLAAFNQKTETEPNIDVLISQTKFLLGKIVHTPTSVNWDQSVR
ncbi:unnamed protein product, partial [Rotaria magnacalcarata]